jgi:hypothetical protein
MSREIRASLVEETDSTRQLLNFSTPKPVTDLQAKSKGGKYPVITAVCLCD